METQQEVKNCTHCFGLPWIRDTMSLREREGERERERERKRKRERERDKLYSIL